MTPRRVARVRITADTIRDAFVCCGEVQTASPVGPRLLASAEELGGLHPAEWIRREKVRHGIEEPWDLQGELKIGA